MSEPTPASTVAAPALRRSPWWPTRPPAGSAWPDFCGWVTWLDDAYELDLPTCWMRHEGLVHTLAGLWHLWRGVYAAGHGGPLPAPGGPASWHTTFLYPFRDRLHTPSGVPGGGCKNRAHRGYSRTKNLDAELAARVDTADADGALRSPGDADALADLAPSHGPAALVALLYPADPYTAPPDRAR